jgi:hypothetical protein
MEDNDVKNTLDSATDKPAAAAARLSEDEKKELEINALMEHEQGAPAKSLSDQVRSIEQNKSQE